MSKHHLCTKNQESGEICTNHCPERLNCKIQKTSIILKSTDVLTSENMSDVMDDLYITSFIPYCVAPEAYGNELFEPAEN